MCLACSVEQNFSRHSHVCDLWDGLHVVTLVLGTVLVMVPVSEGKLSSFRSRRVDVQHTCGGSRKLGQVQGSSIGSSRI